MLPAPHNNHNLPIHVVAHYHLRCFCGNVSSGNSKIRQPIPMQEWSVSGCLHACLSPSLAVCSILVWLIVLSLFCLPPRVLVSFLLLLACWSWRFTTPKRDLENKVSLRSISSFINWISNRIMLFHEKLITWSVAYNPSNFWIFSRPSPPLAWHVCPSVLFFWLSYYQCIGYWPQ